MEHIKIDLEHNLSSLKIPEVKVYPQQTILALKENIQRRYGSQPNYVKLVLKSKKGQIITSMDQELRTLDFYGVKNEMIIHVMDLNPSSIHKQIENTNEIQKYTMSQETYMQLPENFRKWKTNFIHQHPEIINPQGKVQICDPNYLQSLAQNITVGLRCQLENGNRGEVRYVGKVPELGFGYFVGILLDQPAENTTGSILAGNYYFFSQEGKGTFVRPNQLQIGQFPQINQQDEI